jgi:magnesium transporter
MLKALTWSAEASQEVPAEQLPTLIADGTFVWVDITGPTDEELALMRDVFHFHQLAIDDTRNQHQRPKVEEYTDHFFMILNPGELRDEEIGFRELDVFVGKSFIVTVHPQEEPTVAEGQQRAERQFPGNVAASTALYALLDATVDQYFPILDEIGDAIDDLEDMVLERPDHDSLERLFQLKRQLVLLRKVVAPQRDSMGVLYRRDIPFLDMSKLGYHVRDVHDHLLRIADTVDTYRDLLSSGIDLYMSSVSNRLNRVVNRLTVVTVVVGVMAVITGFYGMNFHYTWPSFDARWGVPFAVGLMAVVATTIVGILRWMDWV